MQAGAESLRGAKIGAEAEAGFIVVGRGTVNRIIGFGGSYEKHPQADEQQQDRDPTSRQCAHD